MQIEVIDVRPAPRRLHFLSWVRFRVLCEEFDRNTNGAPAGLIAAHSIRTAKLLGLELQAHSQARRDANALGYEHACQLLQLPDPKTRS